MKFRPLLTSGKGKIGAGLLLAGTLLFLPRFLSALLFYGADERVLYFLPWLAKSTTIEELIAQPEQFDGKWVKLRAEIWRRSEHEAILVPPGSGPEPLARGEEDASLPPLHLETHNFGTEHITTVSAIDAPVNEAVTFVGEFEAATSTYSSHIDAAVISDPRQSQFDGPMVRRLIFDCGVLMGSGVMGVAGILLMRAASRANSTPK